MRVLVTGATGFLGRRLVAALRADGHALRATSRDAPRARATLPHDVETFAWDPGTQTCPPDALAGVTAVFHLMGESIAGGRFTARRKRLLSASRIESTEQLVAALPESVTDFLCASAVGIYPGHTHAPFDEKTPLPAPDSFLARLCTGWEAAAARAACPQRRIASLRIGLVLGEAGMLAALVPLYRMGLGGPIGDGQQRLPWVHVEDVVAMMQFVLARRSLSGPVNLVGPAPVPLAELSRTLASILGRPHFLRVPSTVVRLALGEASALLLDSHDVRPKKLAEADYRFRYSTHRGALEAALAAHFS